MGLELKVEAEFAKRLPKRFLLFKLNLQGNTGWPDRMICWEPRKVAFIEFKAPGRPLIGDRNQPERHKVLYDFGFPILITDSADYALAWLDSVALSGTWGPPHDLASLCGVTAKTRIR